jgi:hypothetical protein
MDCCKPPKTLSQVHCPRCSTQGKEISFVTVSALLPASLAQDFASGQHWFCKTQTCPVLYYGDQGQTVDKERALVRVGQKETQDPLPLCYCFHVTRADIQQEVAQTGRCNLVERITNETRAGNCDCERKNPAGVCCLGELRAAAKEALALHPKEQIEEKHT